MCCSVLQCVPVYQHRETNRLVDVCNVLQCAAVCCSVLPCVAVCCSVLRCVAVCCRVLQCVSVYQHREPNRLVDVGKSTTEYISANIRFYTVLPYNIMHCNTHPHAAMHYNALQHTMGWLRSVGSIKLQVSFAEYSLFYRALLQKRPIILSILLTKATPYQKWWWEHQTRGE